MSNAGRQLPGAEPAAWAVLAAFTFALLVVGCFANIAYDWFANPNPGDDSLYLLLEQQVLLACYASVIAMVAIVARICRDKQPVPAAFTRAVCFGGIYGMIPALAFACTDNMPGAQSLSWLLMLVVGALPIIFANSLYRRDRDPSAKLCVSCGYDLRASAGACPECGTAIANDNN